MTFSSSGLARFGFANERLRTGGLRVTVEAWETAAVFKDGELLAERGPGRYRRSKRSTWYIIDTRVQTAVIPAQELLSADGIQVRITLSLAYRVTNALAWLTHSANSLEELYSYLQIQLRNRVGQTDFDDIASQRTNLTEGVAEAATEALTKSGVAVERIDIKDSFVPNEVRQVLTEVVFAKQRGLAEIERARAQAASLRSLANTAKLIEEHPALLRLQELQSLSLGGQLVIHREGEPDAV